jgi:Periplasmic copper-binding protein (NosD)
VLQAIGKGIMIFEGKGNAKDHAGSDGATITGNMITGVKSVAGTLGVGIHLDSSGTSNHLITGNIIKQCEGSAILGEGGNNDVVVNANVIDGTNLSVAGASISFHSADRIQLPENKIVNNQQGGPIEMKGTSKNWHISDNSFDQNHSNSPGPLSIDSTVINTWDTTRWASSQIHGTLAGT